MSELAIKDLTVEFSSGGYAIRPLDGFDLDVPSGELVLLLGASGCGKTTLLSVLAAILTPTSGSARIGDTDITALRGRALTEYRRHGVGVVFQAFNLVPSLSALENVQVPLRGAGTKGRRARERAAELLDRVGLADRSHHKPSDLSGGQQQRVAIARALVHDPPLLLADEPTAHLDYIQVEGVIRLLRELAAPGRLVVVATHDERMVPLADRVVEMTSRALAGSRPPETVVLEPGEVLFKQGDEGDLIYVVERGELEIWRERVDREPELVGMATAGQYVGELAPLFGLRRSATVRAGVEQTAVTGYTARDFRDNASPEVLSRLLGGATR